MDPSNTLDDHPAGLKADQKFGQHVGFTLVIDQF